MGKKKRKSKPQSAQKRNAARSGSVFKRAGLPLILVAIVALMVVLYVFLGKTSAPPTKAPRSASPGRMLAFPPPSEKEHAHTITYADFAGSDACAACHAREYNLWKTSTHGQAGGNTDEVKIIARFDGKPLQFKDAVVTPVRDNDGTYRFIVEQDGRPVSNIVVEATVGGGHMYGGGTQTFFMKSPDGTVRFLPFDYIRDEDLWFVQLRKDETWVPISKEISLAADLANWPPHRILGSMPSFSNCQNCHGSQITINYDAAKKTYNTRYTTLKINCESCHGPGKRHIELVGGANAAELTDIGMEALATVSKDKSLMVCFQCHATKDVIQENYLPGKPMEEHYSIKMPMLGNNPFLVDGRVRSFAYQFNHLFSDCYINGSMTCVDCHEPHGQAYRDVFGKPLIGKFDNGQCTGCHASKAKKPELHSFHKADSPGNLCTSCHMPFLQHQGVGPDLVFARSDHTIPIPRLAFDTQIGIENACMKCHQQESMEWLGDNLKRWYGDLKPHNRFIANLKRAATVTDRDTAAKLLLMPDGNHSAAQMAGLASYVRQHLKPAAVVDLDVIAKLKSLAEINDADLKSLALTALHIGYDGDPEVRDFLARQLSELGENETAVRNRWGIAADYIGSLFSGKRDFRNAVICYQKSLEVKPDDVITLVNLAGAYRNSGNFSAGISTLETAIRIEPEKASLYFQLAQLYGQSEQIPNAIKALEKGLALDPGNQNARRILEQLQAL